MTQKMSSNIKIRMTSINDVKSIFNIQRKTWLDVYPNEEHGVKYEDIAKRFEDEEKFFKRIGKGIESYGDDSQGWVVELDGKVVGFSVTFKKTRKNTVGAVYVLPEFQNKGIGKLLLQEILKFHKKSKELWLEVATYNKKAIGFYENFGFQIVRGSEGKHEIIKGKFAPTIKMKKVS